MTAPPFTVSAKTINLISEISSLLVHYNLCAAEARELRLRKVNRIKTIHSSLAIEGNNLTENQVADIINGKNIVAPFREIQEVKNAIRVYDAYNTFDAFKENDLLRAHGIMMEALIDRPGKYRKSNVGVYGETGLIHLAPPPFQIPQLMGNIFEWLQNSEDHLLIRSCVFHYELEFIHPFIDGNGRMGRLWQSLILCKWNEVFNNLPVENMIHANQPAYYEAIAKSSAIGNSEPFIDFMIEELAKTIRIAVGNNKSFVGNNVGNNIPDEILLNSRQKSICEIIYKSPTVSAHKLASLLHVSDRTIERDLALLRKAGIITGEGKTKNIIRKLK